MAKGLAARNGGRAGLIALAVILALGLGLRLDYAWQGRTPVFDALAYAKIAENLDRDRGFTLGSGATQPADNYSPGLPLLVAAIYKASGGINERLARLVLALVGAASILFTYLIGRRLASPAAGLLGAAAVAIYPALLEYQGMLMSEPLAATLLAASLLAILWARERSRLVLWLVPGALLGTTAMVRPEYLAIALVLALVILGRGIRADWRASLARAMVLLAGLIVIVSPWTIRNALTLGRFVPLSTGAGQVLFAGTYLPSDGDPQRVGEELLRGHPELVERLAAGELGGVRRDASLTHRREVVLRRVRLEQILAALAAERRPGVESDKALGAMGREQLWHDISEQPLEYAGFIVEKVGLIWSHGPREVMRRPIWEALHWALLALGLCGLIHLLMRRRFEAVLFLAILASITALSALLVASPRRVLVMLPLLAALAGVGVTWLWDQAHSRLDSLGPP